MKSFYTWLMDHLEEDSDIGKLARFIQPHVKELPALEEIDSFSDMLDITDPASAKRYISDRHAVRRLIKESIWLKYCEESEHPVNIKVFDWL